MNLSERYLTLVEKKYKPMVWEDINFGDVVWISTENWNKMWQGNRSLQRYPSDDYMKKLQHIFVNKTLGKVMDVYDNGSADVKFNDKTFRLKVDFLSKLESSEKKVNKEPIPITESITDEDEQEESDFWDVKPYFYTKTAVLIRNKEDRELINRVAKQLGWEQSFIGDYPFYLNISGKYSSSEHDSNNKMLWSKEKAQYTKKNFKVFVFDRGLVESIDDEPEQEEVEPDYYNQLAQRDVEKLAKKFPTIGHKGFNALTYDEGTCAVITVRYAMNQKYYIGPDQKPLLVTTYADWEPELYRKMTIGGVTCGILREFIDTVMGMGYTHFYDYKFEDGYIYYLKGTPAKNERDWKKLKGHIGESIEDEPEQEEESISERVDKYINTDTAVEINSIDELKLLEKMLFPKLTFNSESGRSRAAAVDTLQYKGNKIYVSLKGDIMSSGSYRGKALNYIPHANGEFGHRIYKEKGYTILKFQGKNLVEEKG